MGVPFPKSCVPPYSGLQNDAIVRHVRKLAATASFSNPSIMSTTRLEEISYVEVSPSVLFNNDSMKSTYKKFCIENNYGLNEINATILRVISNLNESLATDEHILYISKKFVECMNEYNTTHISDFTAGCPRNPMFMYEHSNMTIKERLIIHNMYYLRIEKLLLTYFEDGKDDLVEEIFVWIALSHLLMNVPEEAFDILCLLQVKYLLHINVLTDENKATYIYYIQTVKNRMMNARRYVLNLQTLHIAGPDGMKDWMYRENYRQLKKWKNLVFNIHRGLMKPIETFKKQIEESKQLHYDDITNEDVEHSKLIRVLKKGYRFKDVNETQLFDHS